MKRHQDKKENQISHESIFILGAGPAGMACAMELFKSGKKSVIIEKADMIGGLAATKKFEEGNYNFFTDIGPHRFYSKNKFLYAFIEDLLHEKWILVERQTRQYINGKYYDYPVKLKQAIKNIGIAGTIKMALSYLNAFFTYKIGGKKIANFENYIVANFGRKLGEFNMLNYTEKIWGIDSNLIHSDWAKQRIKGLNLRTTLIKSFFANNKTTPRSLTNYFYYPQYGTGLIYETIAKKISDYGSSIKTNSLARKNKS